ncbi:hypothetical protein PRCB_04830 [Pantoea rodasii]|uniref:Uncharacterized protein n=1 Tax=Pantoea rodasii TaxID=1076549 RepID=A0A2M9WET2_9GAMM|nr:hypothetical protein PRCB_04830 [Pantoea rodasii]
MIIILLRFDGGSTEEEHDIAHIASSIKLPASCGLFFLPGLHCCGVGCAQPPQSHTDVCSRGCLRLPPCISTNPFEKTTSAIF